MAKGLATLLSQHAKFRVTEISLNENGMKDEALAEILAGLEGQTSLRIINYNNNALGPKSLA